MPPNRRRFHTNSKKHRRLPETADDFLSAGIEYEESGDRWLPGDKLKAGRFYQRAIDAYQSALTLHSLSFDAAYNKARLQFKVSQERELVPRGALRGILEAALQSHQLCLDIDSKNDDAVFNTAQVHVSLAEEIGGGGEAVRHLEGAWELFSRCLASQQAQYESYSSVPSFSSALQNGDGDNNYAEADDIQKEHEQYAIIQEPITPATLQETTLSLITTLTTLLPLLPAPPPQHLTSAALPLLASLPPTPDAKITAALYACALSESTRDLAAWEPTLTTSFHPDQKWTALPAAQCAKADAHSSLAAAHPQLAWKHYSLAAGALAAIHASDTTAAVYLARGDMELLRARSPGCGEETRKVLVGNAGVYWRAAAKMTGYEAEEARIKESVLRGDWGVDGARAVVEEAVGEGVFGGEALEALREWEVVRAG